MHSAKAKGLAVGLAALALVSLPARGVLAPAPLQDRTFGAPIVESSAGFPELPIQMRLRHRGSGAGSGPPLPI